MLDSFTVTAFGREEAIATLTRLSRMLGPAREVVLEVDERAKTILEVQAERGRNVFQATPEEETEIKAIAERHVEQARDSRGRVGGGDEAGVAMYQEIGEYRKERIVGHIDDSIPIEKEPLSGEYAAAKERKYPGRPILVASGKMLAAVKSAEVIVRTR